MQFSSATTPADATAPSPTSAPTHDTPAAAAAAPVARPGPGGRVVPPRPDWREYFLDFARLAARRATCLRRQVGAVIVKDNMVLTTGYNGAPRGLPHAAEVGCLRDQMGIPSGQRHELCRGLHAEQNAIVQAARHGIRIDGAELYCTHHPCVICLKMILNAGLMRVFYADGYPDPLAQRIIAEAHFEVLPLGAPPPPQVPARLPILAS